MHEPPILQIKQLSKSFGATRVLSGINLDIPRGCIVSLLGRSGSGKTTLLQLIAGLHDPDAGTLSIAGTDMAKVPAFERPVNMMFQSYALFPHLTVEANIAFGLKQEGLPRPEIAERVAEMLALVKLTGFGRRKPHELSGGQRQRVALARALVREPKLLLLDEPLGALDQRLRQAMQVELRAIQRQVGITFLLVTHDQEEALSLSDRVAVMKSGRILQVTAPRELYERPNCRQVADFIGKMNFFHATVRQLDNTEVTVNAGVLGIVTFPRANLMAEIKVGAYILIAIRPEHICFAQDGVQGEILSSTFLGERSHIDVSIAGRSEAVAVSSSTEPSSKRVHLNFPANQIIGLQADD